MKNKSCVKLAAGVLTVLMCTSSVYATSDFDSGGNKFVLAPFKAVTYYTGRGKKLRLLLEPHWVLLASLIHSQISMRRLLILLLIANYLRAMTLKTQLHANLSLTKRVPLR